MRIFAALAALTMLAASAPTAASASQTTIFLDITIPIANGLNFAIRPPVATYEWQAMAGNPDQVRHILLSTENFGDNFFDTLEYIRTNPNAPEWSAWEPYTESWTTPPTDFGRYVFAVQGREGDVIEDEFSVLRNARNVVVSILSNGPVLTVTGTVIDPIITSSRNTPPTVVDVSTDTDVTFCWTADASAYLGVVTDYRYGFDIVDVDDPNGWDVSWTPFVTPEECAVTRRFFFGTHTFTVDVRDYDGNWSRVPIVMNITPPVGTESATWGTIKAVYRAAP